eukprot:TRINITY_DN9189_c0_g2_i1.p1 TRINITY_DN9189_c0_g2~~TRINITY_DN9189_c0_g2_i1.p1  ORF type:complete len:415 (+),score=107.60 TRINITY_DN9189_c0_g2_i1:176-1420(+)
MLSKRGLGLLKPAASYFEACFKAFEDLYSSSNPNGFVMAAIAENSNNFPLIKQKLDKCREITPGSTIYNSMRGFPKFKQSLAGFLEKNIIKEGSVVSDFISVTNGCGSLCGNLALALFEEGDGILIPTPMYPAFDHDFTSVAKLNVIHVPMSGPSFELSIEALEKAYKESEVPIKGIVICNPDNPTGIVRSADEVWRVMKWCEEKGIHLISDEIYACSIHEESAMKKFVSMVDIARQKRGALLPSEHFVWGFSKDFGLSGFRVGVLYSENPELARAMETLGNFSACSNDTQVTLANMLDDQEFVANFLEKQRLSIRKCYETITEILDANDIPYLKSEGAFFLWIDMRKYLKGNTWADEWNLFQGMVDGPKLIMSPGESCRASEPGFFRCCMSSPSIEALEVGFGRLVKWLKENQ